MTKKFICLTALVVLTSVVKCSPVWSQNDITGVIERVTPSSIMLSSGEAYARSGHITVILPDDNVGNWSNLQQGDRVQLKLNAQREVINVTVTSSLLTQRVEQPLIEIKPNSKADWAIKPIDGPGYIVKDAAIHGRAFKAAMKTMEQGYIVFPNRENYDILEVWVGRASSAPTNP
ncbi:MAG: hypothetical protein M3347_07190, partial [Armatimonadota bacterium]|nr:hypothetical protein [Armatimonadota bacterium]